MSQTGFLHVTHQGPTTVVAFETSRIPDDDRFALLQDELMRLASGCKELAFDLSGVRVIPSQLLGLMAWLCRKKLEVSIYNASHEIRETLSFTQLDTILDVRDGPVGPSHS